MASGHAANLEDEILAHYRTNPVGATALSADFKPKLLGTGLPASGCGPPI